MRVSAIASVIRGEGVSSAIRRSGDRIADGAERLLRLIRGTMGGTHSNAILNVSMTAPAARLGGVQSQLISRLYEESRFRSVALLHPGFIEMSGRRWSARWADRFAPTTALRDEAVKKAIYRAARSHNARLIHLEGTAGAPIVSLLGFAEDWLTLVLTVHDFSLFSEQPHPSERELLEVRSNERHDAARRLLRMAGRVIFPSNYLLQRHRELLKIDLTNAVVIEPGSEGAIAQCNHDEERKRVAICGSVKPHKGGELLLSLIEKTPEVEWHLFGGGDAELLRPLSSLRNVSVHGYYSRGTLPALLALHRIGLAVLPSIVPESFSLTLSECWRAAVPVVTFDHGAMAERVKQHGGGWLVPLDRGAAGLASMIQQWQRGEVSATVPSTARSARDSAADHLALYRELGILPSVSERRSMSS